MHHQQIGAQFDEIGSIERRYKVIETTSNQIEQHVVGDVSCCHNQQSLRCPDRRMRVPEIRIFGNDHAVLIISHPSTVASGSLLPFGKIET
jgi:hypothetical protein